MNLYLLKREGVTGYDVARGFVVRAANSDRARIVVANLDYETIGGPGDEGAEPWLDSAQTTCELIGIATKERPGGVLRDFRAA